MHSDAGVEVHFAAQVPHQSHDPKQVFDESFGRGEALIYKAVSAEQHSAVTGEVGGLFATTAATYEGVSLQNPADVLCGTGGICAFGDPSASCYSDVDHLSIGAARVLSL